MRNIYDLDLNELSTYLLTIGEKAYHAKQIYTWLYKKYAQSFTEMTDLSKELIQRLQADFTIVCAREKLRRVAHDGTIKYLLELTADASLVETVLMRFDYGNSVCISTQVGCNMGCKFCASGLLKKKRDLTSAEILAEILIVQRELALKGERVGNIVVMGTGEPFDNYDNLFKALKIVNDPKALEIGARHISISTCGLVPGIKRFAKEQVQYNLAISLHAPNDRLRNELMPINAAYPLKELFAALKEYSLLNNRRLTFEYLLLAGINDREKEADELAQLLKGMNAYINLIPYNNVKEKAFKASDAHAALHFYDLLKKRGVSVTLRQKKGDDIDAACGQLRAEYSRDEDGIL